LGQGWRRYKKEPVSTALSVYHSILGLTPLLPWGEGENIMEHGLENILLKPQEEQIKRQFAILSVFNDSPSSWALWGSRPLKTYRDISLFPHH
jgi:hypothetical protein